MRCTRCGMMHYPRLSPAAIVLVKRGDQILLARSPGFPKGLYSVFAGFVEPGESIEETVAREISEEVGIEVENVTYFGSQPWPFPNSLMVGFTADYAGGELAPDPGEIEDAAWYTADDLPPGVHFNADGRVATVVFEGAGPDAAAMAGLEARPAEWGTGTLTSPGLATITPACE